MTAFAGWAAALLVLALSVVIWPLLSPAGPAQGSMPEGGGRQGAGGRQPALAAGIAMAVCGLSVLLYQRVGRPEALTLPRADAATLAGPGAAADGMTRTQIEGMVARLAARLKDKPQDVEGWRMLARSYETLRRFPEAAQAYEALTRLVPRDVEVLVQYAVALGMSKGQSLSGEPEQLLRQALAIDPQHVQAWALLGGAAFDRGDYAQAVGPWQRVLALVPPDSDVARSIQANIDKAKAMAATSAERGAAAARTDAEAP